MEMRIDRSRIAIATTEDLEKEDATYLAKAPFKEIFQSITYRRECFYGAEATTGSLQDLADIEKLSGED